MLWEIISQTGSGGGGDNRVEVIILAVDRWDIVPIGIGEQSQITLRRINKDLRLINPRVHTRPLLVTFVLHDIDDKILSIAVLKYGRISRDDHKYPMARCLDISNNRRANLTLKLVTFRYFVFNSSNQLAGPLRYRIPEMIGGLNSLLVKQKSRSF